VDLSNLKQYFRRVRICSTHHMAPEVRMGGEMHRFCQKCGKLEPLSAFQVRGLLLPLPAS
jgi:hypothetical protein